MQPSLLAGLNVDKNLNVRVLVVNQGPESLADNVVHGDGLGNHARGLHAALGNDVEHLFEVAEAVGGTADGVSKLLRLV